MEGPSPTVHNLDSAGSQIRMTPEARSIVRQNIAPMVHTTLGGVLKFKFATSVNKAKYKEPIDRIALNSGLGNGGQEIPSLVTLTNLECIRQTGPVEPQEVVAAIQERLETRTGLKMEEQTPEVQEAWLRQSEVVKIIAEVYSTKADKQ